MADSLDDFFARKDRAKKTRVKKPVPEEQTGRAEEKDKKKEKAAAQPVPPLPDEVRTRPCPCPADTSLQEESEWKEVEYEKDYSGLKIHSMTIR